MDKYKFTDDTLEIAGHTLHRIHALRDFGDVKAGDFGGYIDKVENLSQEGIAWVYGNAQVCGNARVYGNAQVYGNARVSGNARVYGDAWVYGNARVSGNARVYGDARVCGDAWVSGGKWEKSPLYIQGTKYSFNIASNDLVRCGCQTHTWPEWHDKYKEIAKAHNAEDILSEYILYFNLACKLYGHEDQMIVEEQT